MKANVINYLAYAVISFSLSAAAVCAQHSLPDGAKSHLASPSAADPQLRDLIGDSPLTTSFVWQGHGGVAVTPLALNDVYNPSGTFVINSLPAGSTIVYAAFEATGWQGPVSGSSGSFNGTPLDTIPPAVNDHFGGWDLCLFRWDVSSLVTGNGAYAFTCNPLGQSYLVFLVVVYEHPALPITKIVINDGSEALANASSTCYFNGFQAGNGSIKVLTQAGDPDGATNEAIAFNDQVIAGPGDIFEANLGPVADYFDIPLTNMDLRDTLTITTGSDWIGLHLAVLTGDPATDISMTPVGAPIQIPPGGGSFNFRVRATNFTANPLDLDLWTRVILPNGSVIAPVLGPVGIILNSGSLTWLRHQSVPAGAPPGFYTYVGCLGEYPGQVWSLDDFPFEKVFVGDNSGGGDRSCSGEEISPIVGAQHVEDPLAASPLQSMVISPNPFNPSTALSYQLSAHSFVSLRVYDTAGRLVATLVDDRRAAGSHEVTFDGSDLPSGIYIYRIETGEGQDSGKLILLK